jgi:hypothetical protein
MRRVRSVTIALAASCILLGGCATAPHSHPKPSPSGANHQSTALAVQLANIYIQDQGKGKFTTTKPKSATYLKKSVWEISFSAPEGLYLASALYCPAVNGKLKAPGTSVSYSEITGGKLYIEKTTPYEILGNEATFTYKRLTGGCIARPQPAPSPSK